MGIEPTIPDHLEMFSAFQHSLSSLRLIQVSIAWSAFVALLGWFPHLRTLGIRGSSFQAENRPAPQISYPLLGRLLVDPSQGNMELFIDRFPKLEQEYEELVIFGEYEHRIAAAFGASLKSRTIQRCKRTSPLCVHHRVKTLPHGMMFC
jgi:hypothetical protein